MATPFDYKIKSINILLNLQALYKNQNAFQIFQLARYSSLILTGIILAKSGISQADIGIYETILLIAGISSFFWVNALLNIFVQRYASYSDSGLTYYTTLLLLFSGSVIIAIAIILSQQFIQNTFFLTQQHIYLLALFVLTQNISNLSEHIFLSMHNAKALIVLSLAHFFLIPVLVFILSALTGNITIILTGLILFFTLKTLLTLLATKKLITPVISKNEFIKLIQLSSPLAISFLLGGIAIYADGIIVNTHFDKATFAMYQYGAREFPLATILAASISVAMIGLITKSPDAGISELNRQSEMLMHKIFPAGILLLLCSQYLFPVIFNPQFAESFIYFNIYLLLIIPRAIIPQAILTAKLQTKFLMRISFFEFLINISASLILLQFIGLAGIAFGTVIAYFFEKTAYILKLQRMHIPITKYIPIKTFCIYSVILIIVFCVVTLNHL